MDMKFKAVVKKGVIKADIEAAACGMAATEFVNQLSKLANADVNITEKRNNRQGVSI
jgi:hypothetical protein